MFINTRWFNPFWSDFNEVLWPIDFHNNLKGTSAFKYSENNDGITYEISIPSNVDETDVQASIKDHVMTITLPKVTPKAADGARQVQVR
jgi:HSP20 family molecular chaperone IbpA